MAAKVRVFLYRGFLSDDECDHLISLAHGAKEEDVGINDDLRKVDKNKKHANLALQLNVEDSVLKMIEERISAWTFLPKELGQTLQVIHYLPEEAEQKLNYFGNNSSLASSESLMATVILYLSNVTRGGDILFPDSEVRRNLWSDCSKVNAALRPVKGNAILFFTRQLNASLDKSSSHNRCPVLDGGMWCAAKHFVVRTINRKGASSDSDTGECTDEDENCFHWAVMGECQRNPVFMVGSPDYYGTCRKSCNAC